MAMRQNESLHGKEYLNQPSLDPAKQDKFSNHDTENSQELTAEFPVEERSSELARQAAAFLSDATAQESETE
ncbi:MAG TPA: hypothetical protein VEA58_02870, partial [Anaerovoracaceae bacterium]|nr:hypothetical protein [Anaerovoracaceae bacterium]